MGLIDMSDLKRQAAKAAEEFRRVLTAKISLPPEVGAMQTYTSRPQTFKVTRLDGSYKGSMYEVDYSNFVQYFKTDRELRLFLFEMGVRG